MAQTQVQALVAVKQHLEKKYKDSTELFLDFTTVREIPFLPSPSVILNAVTGVGGIPRGRVTEIYGPYSSGKTTIGCEIIARAQRENPDSCGLYLDYEHALDARWARTLGCDLSPHKFILAQPEYGEQGGQIAKELLEADLLDWIMIDSAAAMTPRSEMEGELDIDGGTQKGTQAAMMARILHVLTKMINRGRKPALVIMNQTRAKIEIGKNKPDQNPGTREQSAAGNAIKFYSSIRLELEIIKPEGETGRGTKGAEQMYTQNRVRVTCIKNKVAPPFMRGQIVIEYGKGIDNLTSIAELAEARLGIMSGAGFFNYKGDTPETSFSCRGRATFLEHLEQNPELRTEIERKVILSLQSEHAEALGVDEIKSGGKAKEIEYVDRSSDTLVLDDSEVRSIPPVLGNGQNGAGYSETEPGGIPLEDAP